MIELFLTAPVKKLGPYPGSDYFIPLKVTIKFWSLRLNSLWPDSDVDEDTQVAAMVAQLIKLSLLRSTVRFPSSNR